ncbi:MAG: tetratricopeptide repeat protein [Pseudolabrys sp.]
MISSSLARWLAGSALAAVLAATPMELAAKPTSPQDVPGLTAAGAYLAARHAVRMGDALEGADFYRAALKYDPGNEHLRDLTFRLLLVGGNIDEAVSFARRVVRSRKDHPFAWLVLGVHAIKQKHYLTARSDLAKARGGPITDLTASLLRAWAAYGGGAPSRAVATIDKLSGPDWYETFKNLHAGMIYDLAGKEKEAGKHLAQAYKLNPKGLRVVEAYGSWASRNRSRKEALKIFEDFNKALPNFGLVTAAIDKLKAGKKLPPVVSSAQSGAAEALSGIGSSLGRRGEDLGVSYVQLSLYLKPADALALTSLGDYYEGANKPALALKAYGRVPKSSPFHRNAAIHMAGDLDSLDRTQEAENHLEKLIKQHPDDIEAITQLGNIQRARKKFAACAKTYSKGIAAIPYLTKTNWVIFYFRGICYERAHEWPKAEADLKKALKLSPDQPHVLNYLGYSWVDQGKHLDEGMAMIKKAVQQRPDDGYIVDSLGWAYYRLGNYQEAVKQLERAIELKPEDPTINDHLGDAYWRVGRTLEARFQWEHARAFKPDPEELAKIEAKLKHGLDGEASSQAKAGKKEKAGNDGG